MASRIDKTISEIKNGRLTVGSWVQIIDHSVAKIMSSCGFDWLCLDLEHGKYCRKELPVVFDVIRANNCLPLARLEENSANLIKIVLDAGAGGIIVPMINTVEDARQAVTAAKYPPVGTRGIGFANASNYGKEFDNYFNEWNRKVVVIVQIEHINGVKNLTDILAVDGVDGFIVGPYDLTGSMDITGQFDHPDFEKTMNKITQTGRSSDKLLGVHIVQPDITTTLKRIEEGYNFIAYSLDSVVLWSHFSEAMKMINPHNR